MEISLRESIVRGFASGWFSRLPKCRYRVFWGARNTGKSVNIGGYEILMKILSSETSNVLIVRKNDVDNRQSTFANILQCIDSWHLNTVFKARTSPYEIERVKTGQVIFFRGFNNPTSLTSVKVKKGYLTDIYFEEASELNSYEDFIKLDGSLRAGDGVNLQMTFMLNGWDQGCMIYEHFVKGHPEADFDYLESHDYWDYYDPDFSLGYGKGLYLHQSTYKINNFRASYYDENAAIVKIKEPDRYKVEFDGMWGHSGDIVYSCFTEGCIVDSAWAAEQQYSFFAIGIDFGVSDGQGNLMRGKDVKLESATTMQLIGITRDVGKIICIDEYFWSNELQGEKKTGPQMQTEMMSTVRKWSEKYAKNYSLLKGKIPIYVDSADSGGFRQGLEMEAKRQGMFNCVFQPSTKLRILSRIDFANHLMAYQDFLVSKNCENLIREIRLCKRGDNGKAREDINDHAINACEYAWAPFARSLTRWKDMKEH